jgi:hypothetical protein
MRRLLLIVFTVFITAVAGSAQTYSADDLTRRNIERRAVEAMIWGMPAVNTDLMCRLVAHRGRARMPAIGSALEG